MVRRAESYKATACGHQPKPDARKDSSSPGVRERQIASTQALGPKRLFYFIAPRTRSGATWTNRVASAGGALRKAGQSEVGENPTRGVRTAKGYGVSC